MNQTNLLIGLLAVFLLAAVAVEAATSPKTAPIQDPQDASCLNQEIAAYKAASAASVQSQAELALAQAQAYAALYTLQQAC